MNNLRFTLASFEHITWPDVLFMGCLVLLFLFVFIWIICKFIASLNSLFGNRMISKGHAIDQGLILSKKLDQLDESLKSLSVSQSEDLGRLLETFIDKEVTEIGSTLKESQNQLSQSLTDHVSRQQAMEVLSEEEKRLGRIFSRVQRRLLVTSQNTDIENKGIQTLVGKIGNILRDSDSEYILFIKHENLKFEPEDSFSVRVAKTFRRVIRWAERRSRWFLQPVHYGDRIKMIKVRSVSYRRIINNRLRNEFQASCISQYKSIRQISSKLKSLTIEVSRVSRFNLETASAELEENGTPQSAKETAIGGLDRSLVRIESILPEKDELIKNFLEEMKSESEKAISRIRRDCDFADTIGEMSTRLVDQFKKQFINQLEPTQKRLRVAALYSQRIWNAGKQRLTRAKTSLGLEAQSSNELVGLLDNATIGFAHDKVPALYRRVFRFEPLSDEEFFVGRGEELTKIENAFKRWNEGRPTSIAIHGPAGSGKTSLIQCSVHRYFQDQKVFHQTITQTVLTSVDLFQFLKQLLGLKDLNGFSGNITDLAESATKQVGKAVVIVEGLQHMFQRRIGGFHVIQDFFRFMVLTRAQFLWVICTSELGWTFLDYTKNISKYFVYQIATQNMSRKALENIIMVRHEITGYNLEFDTGRGLPRDLSWRVNRMKDSKEIQSTVRNSFFDELHDLTEGNIFSALYYWLCSIEFNGDEKVSVKFPKAIPQDSIRGLSRVQLATLHAVLQHGSLDSDVHSQIFRSQSFMGEGILSELERKNILEQKNGKGYSPNPIVVPTVIKILKERNLVYK